MGGAPQSKLASTQRVRPEFLGILNCTPDSFSDGGQFDQQEAAIQQAHALHRAGARYVDIGADASGPGSQCVGPEREWERLEPVITVLAQHMPLSIDTHHAAVARKSIRAGVHMINDISAGADPEMFSVIAESQVQYILMCSTCPRPHQFEERAIEDWVAFIVDTLRFRVAQARQTGIAEKQILIDPGMGAFLSPDPEVSWKVLRALDALFQLGYPVVLGISRKRFLKNDPHMTLADLDQRSAVVAHEVWQRSQTNKQLYFRVHNVALHQKHFSCC